MTGQSSAEPAKTLPAIPESLRRQIVSSAGARTAALVIAALFTVLSSRLVIGEVGPSAFGFVAMIAALSALMSFTDLGLGAAVTNAAARHSEGDSELEATTLSAVRVLSTVALTILVVCIPMYALHGWSALLGVDPGTGLDADKAATLVVTLFALGIPLGLGQRLLVGAGRNAHAIALAAVGPALTYALLRILVWTQAPTWVLPSAWAASALAISSILTIAAARRLDFRVRTVARHALDWRRHPGAPVRSTAAPMFVIMVALPLALQTDRIVLSHQSGLHEVAVYSLVALLYTPFWAVITSMGMTLWPWFTRRRHLGESTTRTLIRTVILFAAMGAAGMVTLIVLGPWVLPIASANAVSVPLTALAASGLVLLVQSTHTPAGMFLTDPWGLRFQAIAVSAMVVLNLFLSWQLAPRYGAAGPLLATAISVAICQLVPSLVAALRRSRMNTPLPVPVPET